MLAGVGYCLIGIMGLGIGAIVRHSSAAVGVLVGVVYVLGQVIGGVFTAACGYVPIALVANSLSTVKHVAARSAALGGAGHPDLLRCSRARCRWLAARAARRLIAIACSRANLERAALLLSRHPLGCSGFVVIVVSFAFGLGLAVTFVGLPLLALNGRVARGFGTLDRRLARGLLDQQVADPRPFASGRGFFGWLQAALTDPVSWRARAYLVVKLPLAFIGFYLTLALYGMGLFWLTYPLWWQLSGPGTSGPEHLPGRRNAGLQGARRPAPPPGAPADRPLRRPRLYVDTWPKALLLMAAGLVVLLIAPWVVRGLACAAPAADPRPARADPRRRAAA